MMRLPQPCCGKEPERVRYDNVVREDARYAWLRVMLLRRHVMMSRCAIRQSALRE